MIWLHGGWSRSVAAMTSQQPVLLREPQCGARIEDAM